MPVTEIHLQQSASSEEVNAQTELQQQQDQQPEELKSQASSATTNIIVEDSSSDCVEQSFDYPIQDIETEESAHTSFNEAGFIPPSNIPTLYLSSSSTTPHHPTHPHHQLRDRIYPQQPQTKPKSSSVLRGGSTNSSSSSINKLAINHNPNKYNLDYFKHFNYQNSKNRIPIFENSYLHSNALFTGVQESGKSRFHIKVEFKNVDLINSIVTGFLQISGLTDDHSEIVTCFKGEIINNPLHKYQWANPEKKSFSDLKLKNYSFITENKQWGSFTRNDFEHWKKLTNSSDLTDAQLQEKLIKIQQGQEDNRFIYMRWKEEFLLPDSRVKQISGASFEGFYYIVLNIGGYEDSIQDKDNLFSNNISPGSICGLYYHKSSEKFQSLVLQYVENHGIANTFEFV